MPFINFNQQKKVRIWDGINGALRHSGKITFGHIIIDEGTLLPEHHHPHEQWTHVIEGKLLFDIAGEQVLLEPGMSALVPPDTPHSGKALTRCFVIDCFTPVREDFKALKP